jgi:hypothetical protein
MRIYFSYMIVTFFKICIDLRHITYAHHSYVLFCTSKRVELQLCIQIKCYPYALFHLIFARQRSWKWTDWSTLPTNHFHHCVLWRYLDFETNYSPSGYQAIQYSLCIFYTYMMNVIEPKQSIFRIYSFSSIVLLFKLTCWLIVCSHCLALYNFPNLIQIHAAFLQVSEKNPHISHYVSISVQVNLFWNEMIQFYLHLNWKYIFMWLEGR